LFLSKIFLFAVAVLVITCCNADATSAADIIAVAASQLSGFGYTLLPVC